MKDQNIERINKFTEELTQKLAELVTKYQINQIEAIGIIEVVKMRLMFPTPRPAVRKRK